ncbi:hypothetical protein DXG01_008657 [Tephrocybe rancida]|nr:hypothetical protein DXG01_008657 [Tephrocybe rancida]
MPGPKLVALRTLMSSPSSTLNNNITAPFFYSTWNATGLQVIVDVPTYRARYHKRENALDGAYQGTLREYQLAVDNFDQACKSWLDSRCDLSILETKQTSDRTKNKYKKSRLLNLERLQIKTQQLDTIRKEKDMCAAYALKAKLELAMAEEAAAWAQSDDESLYKEMEFLYDDLSAESGSTSSESSLDTVEDAFEDLCVIEEVEDQQVPSWANEYLAQKQLGGSSSKVLTLA